MRQEEKLYGIYLERLKKRLIANYNHAGLKASGKYEEELVPEIKGNKLIMWGAHHSYFMEHGRTSGGMPPIKAIERWIEVKKGLPQSMKENKHQVKWAIAKKIAKEGIKVPNQHNRGKVISTVLENFLAKDVYEMLDTLGVIYRRRIESDILKTLESI